MKFTRKSQARGQTALERRRADRRARVVRSSISSSNVAQKASKPTLPRVSRQFRVIGPVVIILLLFWTALVTGIEIEPSDNSKAYSQTQTVADSYFKGFRRIWWFVSGENLAKIIESDAPYVESISIKHSFFTRRIIIQYKARQPSLRLRSQNRQYVVSKDGVILEESLGDEALPLVYDESKAEATLKLHKQYLPAKLVEQIISTDSELKKPQNSFKVKEYVLLDNIREIEAHQEKGYFIKFNTTTSAARQIEDLNTARGKINPTRLQSLQYIDLRFNGHVYIK